MKKTSENIVHYDYIYNFDPLFRENKGIYKWIMKKYLSERDIDNFEIDIQKIKENKKFHEEMKILKEDINLNNNIHPFHLRLSSFKKEYLKILVLFISNYDSITSKNVLQLEKISRQLSISSKDLKKFLKSSLQSAKNIQPEEYSEKLLEQIDKLNLNEIETRILMIDFILFIYFQKEQRNNKFVKLFLKKLKITTKEIRYITKEIIEKQEEKNEK